MFEMKIAFRFLKDGRHQTILILTGIAIGVAVQVFLYSLISGLQEDLINRTVGNSYHIRGVREEVQYNNFVDNDTISISKNSNIKKYRREISDWNNKLNEIRENDEITEILGVYDAIGIISKGKSENSILIRGMDIDEKNDIYNLSKSLTAGKLISGVGEVLLGSSIASDLNIDSGEFISIRDSKGKENKLYISGIYDLNNESINSSWIFCNLTTAQKLFGKEGYITSIEIQVSDIFEADIVADKLNRLYGDMKFENWKDNNKNLLIGLKSQSSSSNTIQVFVILAVALGISSVLAVSVMQKSKEIGILKAMGTTNKSISKIFLIEGAILGFSGSVVGILIGYGIVKIFSMTSVAFKVSVSYRTVIVTLFVSTFVGTLSAFIPSKNSAKLSPVEVINNG